MSYCDYSSSYYCLDSYNWYIILGIVGGLWLIYFIFVGIFCINRCKSKEADINNQNPAIQIYSNPAGQIYSNPAEQIDSHQNLGMKDNVVC